MSMQDLSIFKHVLFSQLKNDEKKSLDTLTQNSKLIEEHLNNSNPSEVKQFVNEFNDVVLDKEIKNYKLFEAVLNHKLFTTVLAEFNESNVLIRACKNVNIKAVKWLLTMNINYEVQDEFEMTALLHAVEHNSLDFAVKKMIKKNKKLVNHVDSNKNNILFHAIYAPEILKSLLKEKMDIDINHLNNENENLLIYSCRNNKMSSFEILNKYKSFDPNLKNCLGKTAAMYLVENARFNEIKTFVKKNNIDPNYRNKFGDSLVSVFIKKYYQHYIGDIGETEFTSNYNYVIIKNYALTLKSLIDLKCDFNVPVDDDGNTIIKVLYMMEDNITSKYLIDHANINLPLKSENNLSNNKYPINKNYAQTAQKWVLEIFYPNKVKDVALLGNSHRNTNPESFGNLMHHLNTCGLGTY